MPQQRSRLCKGCWQNFRIPVPLHGAASVPFRVLGIRPSRMNPNTCTICELMFTRIMRARQITVDDARAGAIWDRDGLLNKTIGDSIMAVFNFPIRQTDHALGAMRAKWSRESGCAV